ncbi:6-carboxyhexanoate--CoA ligase [Thermodesulfovibrio hydrogeniphilus]
MWSVRMRASKNEHEKEKHISGAEGIYDFSELNKAINQYLKRAFEHSRGQPDKIVLTVEKIEQPVKKIPALPIKTIFCNTKDEAMEFVRLKLKELGVSENAIDLAFEVIKNQEMRGATMIDSLTGKRLEPDIKRGVRVSRIHMDKNKRLIVLRQIKKLTPQPQRVVEALTIASKVSSRNDIVAELCISDNPDYTTGYLASRDLGYLRITNIKNRGDEYGGRAFFIKMPCNIADLIYFLEKTPVIVL